jgi:hypothetical protein
MLRKQFIAPRSNPAPGVSEPGVSEPETIDVAGVATVLLTSESPEHPIEHALDGHGGPGGTRWVAGEPGEQTIVLAFDSPRTIREVLVEVEEPHAARTQQLQLALSDDHGQTYREILRQEYNFSPPGTTFEREQWAVSAEGVTHLRLVIQPDKGGQPSRATLTSLVLR